MDKDHQCKQYYEHCRRSIVPRKFKKTQQSLPLFRLDEKIYSSGDLLGEKKLFERPTLVILENFIRTRKGKLAGRSEQSRCTTVLCGESPKKGQMKSAHLSPGSGKEKFYNHDETKSKQEQNKTKKSKKNAYHGQSVCCGSRAALPKWQLAKITLHAGFTTTLMSRERKRMRC